MRTFRLVFRPRAKKAFDQLDKTTRERFSKKLKERLSMPHVPSAKLRRMPNCYKIKLSSVGYRLVYQVHNQELVVLVLAVGRRDGEDAYDTAIVELARQ